MLGSGINVYRVNVASDESGTGDPEMCGDGTRGTGATKDTYFGSSYCYDGAVRSVAGDVAVVAEVLDEQVPEWHVAMVAVNPAGTAGRLNGKSTGGNVGWFAATGDWGALAIHELGHAAFDLADEYAHLGGCDPDAEGGDPRGSRDHAPGGELTEPNVTSSTDPEQLKWRLRLTPGVPVPTMTNPDCAECDSRANVLDDDRAIGLFEGAENYHCDRFRPAFTCKMRDVSKPFCTVCLDAIATALSTFADPGRNLAVEPWGLPFGEVAHGLSQVRAITVYNIRAGYPAPLEVELTLLDSDRDGFPFRLPYETESGSGTDKVTISLPPPVLDSVTSVRLFIAFDSNAGGDRLWLEKARVASTEDPDVWDEVDLVAREAPPTPLDTVLAIDRSGSMAGATGFGDQRKIEHAIEAAQLYLDLLRDDDRAGLVRYNDASAAPDDVPLELTPAHSIQAQGIINGLHTLDVEDSSTSLFPTGDTSIGAGLERASHVLAEAGSAPGGPDDGRRAQAIVVLTDGRQNTPPGIAHGHAEVEALNPQARVFAVGLGLNQLEDRLVRVASTTNGVAHVARKLDRGGEEEDEFALQKLYVQILSDVTDEAFVTDPLGVVRPGEMRSIPVRVAEVDAAVDFVVAFRPGPRFPKSLAISLVAPDGTAIDAADAAAMPNVEYSERSTHAYYRVRLPAFADCPGAHVGAWRVRVENLDRPEWSLAGPCFFTVMAKARSDLRLAARIVQPDHRPGTPFEVVLEATIAGRAYPLSPPIEVRVTRPDGVKRSLALDADGRGGYRGTFRETDLVGPYWVRADVWVRTPRGNLVTRYREMNAVAFVPLEAAPPRTRPVPAPDCEAARGHLRALADFIEGCCAGAERGARSGAPPAKGAGASDEEAAWRLERMRDYLESQR